MGHIEKYGLSKGQLFFYAIIVIIYTTLISLNPLLPVIPLILSYFIWAPMSAELARLSGKKASTAFYWGFVCGFWIPIIYGIIYLFTKSETKKIAGEQIVAEETASHKSKDKKTTKKRIAKKEIPKQNQSVKISPPKETPLGTKVGIAILITFIVAYLLYNFFWA